MFSFWISEELPLLLASLLNSENFDLFLVFGDFLSGVNSESWSVAGVGFSGGIESLGNYMVRITKVLAFLSFLAGIGASVLEFSLFSIELCFFLSLLRFPAQIANGLGLVPFLASNYSLCDCCLNRQKLFFFLSSLFIKSSSLKGSVSCYYSCLSAAVEFSASPLSSVVLL